MFRIQSVLAATLMLCACGGGEPPAPAATVAEAGARAPGPSALPPAVGGWREYPLRDGVVSIRPGRWRTDVVNVPVPAGKGLEYKLTMKKGEGIVYAISYEGLEHPGMLAVEFHGHTEQVDGVGDLMFYSKTGGTPESGTFLAPWDGIHGWYLKNDSDKEIVAKLELAGFYELEAK